MSILGVKWCRFAPGGFSSDVAYSSLCLIGSVFCQELCLKDHPSRKEGEGFFSQANIFFFFLSKQGSNYKIFREKPSTTPQTNMCHRNQHKIYKAGHSEKNAVCNKYFQIMFTQEWFPFKKWFFGFFYASFCACVCGKTWHSCPNLKISLIKQCISCGLSGRSLANLKGQVGLRQIRISK